MGRSTDKIHYVSKKTDSALIKILETCMGFENKEDDLLLIIDDSTKEIGYQMERIFESQRNGKITVLHEKLKDIHGEEPSKICSESMKKHKYIIGMTKTSLAHTNARKTASLNGSRYLSLPDYSWGLLEIKSF